MIGRPAIARRRVDALERAHAAVRRANALTAEAEQIVDGYKNENATLSAGLDQANATIRQQTIEIARWRERAEQMRRAEEHSWQLAVIRGDQLRRHDIIPAADAPGLTS